MSRMSRRSFLRLLATGVSAAYLEHILAGCSPASESGVVTEAPTSWFPTSSSTAAQPASTEATQPALDAQPNPTEPAQEPESSSTPLPLDAAYLAVARGGEPGELVRRAVSALGGMQAFVPAGADVIIKPNMCVAYHTYEYAATTNPWIVGELVKMAYEAGAKKVRVMDLPFGGTPEQAYTKTGIEEQVKANGGIMEVMTNFKYVVSQILEAKDLEKIEIYEDVLKADVVINVPIAKHHSLAGLTLGMKNLMGVIKHRELMHNHMGERLTDLLSLVRPELTVVDAVRILMDNGPTGGDLNDVKQLDTVIASADIVAADSYATSLFGKAPDDIAYIAAAAARGLGRKDLENLRIEEIAVGT